jgi:hypothetical protein
MKIVNYLYRQYYFFEIILIFFIFQNFEQRNIFFLYYLPFLILKLSFNNEFYIDLVFKKKISFYTVVNNFYIPVTQVIFLLTFLFLFFFIIVQTFFLNKNLFNLSYNNFIVIFFLIVNLFFFLINFFFEKFLVKINQKKFAYINFFLIFFSIVSLSFNLIYGFQDVTIIICSIFIFFELLKFLLYSFFFKDNIKKLFFKFKKNHFNDLRLFFFLRRFFLYIFLENVIILILYIITIFEYSQFSTMNFFYANFIILFLADLFWRYNTKIKNFRNQLANGYYLDNTKPILFFLFNFFLKIIFIYFLFFLFLRDYFNFIDTNYSHIVSTSINLLITIPIYIYFKFLNIIAFYYNLSRYFFKICIFTISVVFILIFSSFVFFNSFNILYLLIFISYFLYSSLLTYKIYKNLN